MNKLFKIVNKEIDKNFKLVKISLFIVSIAFFYELHNFRY